MAADLIAEGRPRLPYEEIRNRLQADLEGVLTALFRGGTITPTRRRGGQYRIEGLGLGGLEVIREGRRAGHWYCLGEAQGGDIIALIAWAEWHDKDRRDEAWLWAAQRYGLARDHGVAPARTRRDEPGRAGKPRETAGEAPRYKVVRVHDEAPAAPPQWPRGHRPVAHWPWRDAAGRLRGYTYRIEWTARDQDGEPQRRKVVLPLVWAEVLDTRTGAITARWWNAGIPAPRPVLGLAELLARPGTPRLFVEGEKKVDAARRLFPHLAPSTWIGGTNAVTLTDLAAAVAGEHVIYWPDADPVNPRTGRRPGVAAAEAFAAAAIAAGALSVRVVGVAGQRFTRSPRGDAVRQVGRRGGLFDVAPPKWDLADPLPDGWTEATLHELLVAAEPLLPLPEAPPPSGKHRLLPDIAPHFASAPLPAFAATARLDDTLRHFFERALDPARDTPLQVVIAAAAGLGKSSRAAAMLERFAKGRNGEVYVPDHRLAEQWKRTIEREAPSLRAVVIRGRSQGKEKGEAPCQKWETAEAVAEAGLSVYDHLCSRQADDGSVQRCPFFHECPYLAQFNDPLPAVRIFVHQYISLPRSQGLPEPDFVIVDERFVFHLAPVRDFGFDRVTARRDWGVLHDDGIDDTARWFMHVAHTTARALRSGSAFYEELRQAGLTADDFAEMARVESSFAPAARITPEMPELEQRQLAEGYRPFRLVHRFWRQIEMELRLGRSEPVSVRLRENVPTSSGELVDRVRVCWRRRARFADGGGYERSDDGGTTWHGVALKKLKEQLAAAGRDAERDKIRLDAGATLSLPPAEAPAPLPLLARASRRDALARRARGMTPVLVLDADADAEILGAVLPEAQIVEIAVDRRAEVCQVWDTRNSKHRLIYGERAGAVQSELVSMLRSLSLSCAAAAAAGAEHNGRVLVVTNKPVEDEIGAEILGLAACDLAHFGAVRGIDDWKHHAAIVVVGREQPAVPDLEDLAAAFFYDAEGPVKRLGTQQLPTEARGYRLRDGRQRGVAVQIHPDRRVQAVLEQMREKECAQAIDRLRLVHAREKRVVYLLSNVVCDVTVDTLVTWRDAVAGGDRLAVAWQRSGGVLPLAYAALSIRHPDLWGSEEAAKQWFKGKSVRSLIESSIREPTLLIGYRRAGQRGRASTALLGAELLDPRAVLEEAVGPLSAFEVLAVLPEPAAVLPLPPSRPSPAPAQDEDEGLDNAPARPVAVAAPGGATPFHVRGPESAPIRDAPDSS